MVSKNIIENIFDNIIGKGMMVKCKPPIDETAFDKLRTNEEIAEFFGFEYLEGGRPDLASDERTWANESIAFYDKRNHVLLNFLTHEDMRMKGLDFSNNHKEGDTEDEYIANLKDVIRAYYEAPYVLKKGLWLMQFENGTDIDVAGECNMYGVNMYRASLWGDVADTMYHEMTHCLAFQNLDWQNGKTPSISLLPSPLQSMWREATEQDYKFQEQNNIPHRDTSKYAEKNQHEDFAEMGAVIAGKMTKKYTHLSHSYRVWESDPVDGNKSHRQTLDEIIENNPHRAKLMKELMKNGKKVDIENKREYIGSIYQEEYETIGGQLKQVW